MPEQSGIYFKDKGAGFPVLLIHGFCENLHIWDSFSKKLATDYRVLSIDLPGFGKSPILKGQFSIEDVASKVLEWLSSLKINTCIVIGHSLGGYVTLAMAGQKPNSLGAFGLFHSTAYPDTEEKKISRNKVIEFVSSHGVKTFIESFIPPLFYDQANPHVGDVVKLASETPKETLIAYAAAMRDRLDHADVIRDFKGPILFISGEKDGVVGPETTEKQSKMASKPMLHVMAGVAHMGMFEQESQSLEMTLNFLKFSSQQSGGINV